MGGATSGAPRWTKAAVPGRKHRCPMWLSTTRAGRVRRSSHTYLTVVNYAGSGNDVPKADNLVVSESPIYEQGEFAGVTAEGRPNKIVEVVIGPGPSEAHRQLGS